MTTVYVPRLIESAEQAEALPIGTVALVAKPTKTMPVGELYRAHKGMRDLPAVKVMADRWYAPGALTRRRDAEVVDGHALVPIEAEEEWRASWPADGAHQRCRDERTARLWADQQDAVAMSRLVAPWEPA